VVSGDILPEGGTLTFTEPHRVAAVNADVFGIIVSDSAAPSIHEWHPAPGETITLRPGDRLSYPPGARLRFESGKRIPGAPASGAAWAQPSPLAPRSTDVVAPLGLAVTLLLGGFALLGPSAPTGQAGAVIALSLVLASVAWTEGWALYAGRLAPELFLGNVRTESLAALPNFVLDETWARRLRYGIAGSLMGLLIASASALAERTSTRIPGGHRRGLLVWTGTLGLAAVGSWWPREPWPVIVLAFGILASSIGPVLAGGTTRTGRARAVACGVGLAVFVLAGVAGRLTGGPWAASLAAYPALAAGPVAWIVLRLARPRVA
jgi:hypothetical protein